MCAFIGFRSDIRISDLSLGYGTLRGLVDT